MFRLLYLLAIVTSNTIRCCHQPQHDFIQNHRLMVFHLLLLFKQFIVEKEIQIGRQTKKHEICLFDQTEAGKLLFKRQQIATSYFFPSSIQCSQLLNAVDF